MDEENNSMEHQWNNSNRRKLRYLGEDLSQGSFFYYKFCTGLNPVTGQ
jgi:hypothetical protein